MTRVLPQLSLSSQIVLAVTFSSTVPFAASTAQVGLACCFLEAWSVLFANLLAWLVWRFGPRIRGQR